MVRFVEKRELRPLLQACGGDPDRAASTVAGYQRGVITTEQLHCLGVTRHVVAHRLAHGLLHRIFRGVFLWGAGVPADGASEVAGLLACRRRGVIASLSAAALWGMVAFPSEVFVLVSTARNRSRPGLVFLRTDTLAAGDTTTRRGLPLTSPLRTALDLAAIGYPQLERAISNGHAAGLFDAAALDRYLEQRAGLPGAPALRAVASFESGGFTRSQNERRLRALCRRARLPQPRTNALLCGWEVDFLWAAERLVVEVDAINTHGHRGQFARDRRKQADLVAAGYAVLRVIDHSLHHDELAVIANLAQALARSART